VTPPTFALKWRPGKAVTAASYRELIETLTNLCDSPGVSPRDSIGKERRPKPTPFYVQRNTDVYGILLMYFCLKTGGSRALQATDKKGRRPRDDSALVLEAHALLNHPGAASDVNDAILGVTLGSFLMIAQAHSVFRLVDALLGFGHGWSLPRCQRGIGTILYPVLKICYLFELLKLVQQRAIRPSTARGIMDVFHRSALGEIQWRLRREEAKSNGACIPNATARPYCGLHTVAELQGHVRARLGRRHGIRTGADSGCCAVLGKLGSKRTQAIDLGSG
jgi:hypothetical protein